MAKKGSKDVHVIKNPDGGWDAKEGNRVLSTNRTQANAIKKGKAQAGRDRVDLVVHRRTARSEARTATGASRTGGTPNIDPVLKGAVETGAAQPTISRPGWPTCRFNEPALKEGKP
jgi:Uncharacterized protein conserved in bacteria (DUF2188)